MTVLYNLTVLFEMHVFLYVSGGFREAGVVGRICGNRGIPAVEFCAQITIVQSHNRTKKNSASNRASRRRSGVQSDSVCNKIHIPRNSSSADCFYWLEDSANRTNFSYCHCSTKLRGLVHLRRAQPGFLRQPSNNRKRTVVCAKTLGN